MVIRRCWAPDNHVETDRRVRRLLLVAFVWPLVLLGSPHAQVPASKPGTVASAAGAELRATTHPSVPVDPDRFWLVPPSTWQPGTATARAAALDLGRAAVLIAADKPTQALALIKSAVLAATPLRAYAAYLKGVAELKAKRIDEARRTFAALRADEPSSALLERVLLREADAAEAAGDDVGAMARYDQLASAHVVEADQVLLRLARAAARQGDRKRATLAWQRLYYEYSATEAGATAAQELKTVIVDPLTPGSPRFEAELARGERLFTARRYALARDGFEPLLPHAAGDVRELASLRIAECDYFLRRFRSAADRTQTLLESASRRTEALYFHLVAVRGLGESERFVALVRRLVRRDPDSPWAEEALNSLASHYLILNEDEQADAVFRELIELFPGGRHAERAGWKAGWWAYKHGRPAETADVFERSAATFPRSDYRPSWLYWAGRAREATGATTLAVDRYRLAVTDYAQSYYGRLAVARLQALKIPPSTEPVAIVRASASADTTAALPTAELIAWLIRATLYDEALDEIVYAKRAWGRSPALEATRAWLLNRKGELRPGITAMRQTYPQFLAAGGETLPAEMQRVIFPLDYWPLICQYAEANRIDPYLVAALVAQESTFDPAIRSGANAIGLMQIIPSTGRQWARKLGIRGFSTRQLTTPAINIRIGTAYFADLMKQFGGVHFGLAGYNAGGHRVARWTAERPDLAREEFIDDIPFPETQNYVKRILGTAEDYRRLYAGTAITTQTPVIVKTPEKTRR